jgi:serine/threonine-protein kinase
LYSLGVVAYECLAGAVPFSGPPLEVAAAHRYRPLPPLPAGVPPGAAALVAGLTAKDPAARPASAAAAAERAGSLRDTLAGGTTVWGGPRQAPAAARDTLAGGTTVWGGPGQAPAAALAADAQPATLVQTCPPALADGAAAGRPPIHRRLRGGRSWPGRGLALAAVAVTAGLAGWLLASGGASPQHPAVPPTGAPASSAPARRTVTVNSGSLVGRPVSMVRHQLLLLGLQPRVAWIPSGRAPGTVVSVQPTGQLPAGTTVLVTAAAQPDGHRHGGNGNGNGNGGD